MAFTQLSSFTKTVSMLPDNPALTPSALKAQFDAAPSELLTYFNNLITALKQTTSGDSGAKNVGATTITGRTGNDVQTILEGLGADVNTLKTAPTLQYPSLLNGWVEQGAPYTSHYYKNGDGVVHFYICVKNGSTAVNVVVANLPTGYRPISSMMMHGYADGAAGGDIIYHVNSAGEVKFLRTFTQPVGNFIILQGSFQGV